MEQTPSAPIPPYASEILLRLQTPGCPEDRLMLAVVLDAVAVLRECATGVYPHVSRLVTSTARWFTSADESWPLSFVNVCRTLGLGAPTLLDPPAANKVVPFTPAVDMPLGGASSVRRRTRG
jgi:hypothetical protein